MSSYYDKHRNSGEELRQSIEKGLQKMRKRERTCEQAVARTRRFFEIDEPKGNQNEPDK